VTTTGGAVGRRREAFRVGKAARPARKRRSLKKKKGKTVPSTFYFIYFLQD
jgi:hypothetical protein